VGFSLQFLPTPDCLKIYVNHEHIRAHLFLKISNIQSLEVYFRFLDSLAYLKMKKTEKSRRLKTGWNNKHLIKALNLIKV
jgi:hypothetical protein